MHMFSMNISCNDVIVLLLMWFPFHVLFCVDEHFCLKNLQLWFDAKALTK